MTPTGKETAREIWEAIHSLPEDEQIEAVLAWMELQPDKGASGLQTRELSVWVGLHKDAILRDASRRLHKGDEP